MVAYSCVRLVWQPSGAALIDTYDSKFATYNDQSKFPSTFSEVSPTGLPVNGVAYATPYACNIYGILPDRLAAFANVDLRGTSFGLQGAQAWASTNCGDSSICTCTYAGPHTGTSPLSPSKCPAFNLWAGGPTNFYYSASGQAITINTNGGCAGVYPKGGAADGPYSLSGIQYLPLDGVVLGRPLKGQCASSDLSATSI